MSKDMNEIKTMAFTLIQQGDGPNAVEETLVELFSISAEEAHQIYLQEAGIKTKSKERYAVVSGAYQDNYPELAFKLLILGKGVNEIAEHFGVDAYTINTWRDEIPEFGDAWQRSLEADFAVAETLLRTALGYKSVDYKMFCAQGEIVYGSQEKVVEPNQKAIDMWLKSRHPGVWKETQHIEQTLTHTIDNMTDEQIEDQLAKAGFQIRPESLSSLPSVEE